MKQLTLARYRELEQLVASLPQEAPGRLAMETVALGDLGLVKANTLIRYRDNPVTVIKSHNPDQPKYPGKSFLTLEPGGSSRVKHTTEVEVLRLGEKLTGEDLEAIHQLASVADYAHTASLVVAQARKAGADLIMVGHQKADGSDATRFWRDQCMVDTYMSHAGYLSPTWISGFSAHLDAFKSFNRDFYLHPRVSMVLEGAPCRAILPYLDSYLVPVAEIEGLFQAAGA